MPDTYVEHIWVDKVDIKDVLALQLALSVIPFGYEVKHILDDVREGYKQLWRGVNAKGQFVVVTEIIKHPKGSQLHVWALGGRGYLQGLDETYKTLMDYGRQQGCFWLTGQVKREGFIKAYNRFPHKDTFRVLLGEIT